MSLSRVANIPTDPTISPNYRVSNWKTLNLTLKSTDVDWKKAVEIFSDRIHGRFLAQVRALESNPQQEIVEFSGFAIIALDCLLIETLGQFYKGDPKTKGKHEDHFIEFFRNSKHFSNEFDASTGGLFYRHFRCGILHQAQTMEKSRIRFGLKRMVDYVDPNDKEQGLILDRVRLHGALLLEIKDYEQLLKTPRSEQDREKRDNFIKKWSFIVP